MQRRKHIQLDLRVSFIPCRAKDYCEKRHRHRKKRRAATTNPTGPGSGAESSEATFFKKKEGGIELLELSLDFLFPDSPCGLLCCDNFHWGDQSVNNFGTKSAGCLSQRGSLSRKALALH